MEKDTAMAAFAVITLTAMTSKITPEGTVKIGNVLQKILNDAMEYAKRKAKEARDGQ